MILRREAAFADGLTPLVGSGAAHPELGMDFGVLSLPAGGSYRDSRPSERAFLLLKGAARVHWPGGRLRIYRASLLQELPTVIHVPARAEVSLSAEAEGVEMSVHAAANQGQFPARVIGPEQVAEQTLGGQRVGPAARRTLRTVIDDERAPHSNMLLGEILASGWSSYPPHHHPHPEIYHYRFLPESGFGLAELGEEAFRVGHRDTLAIGPHLTHSQSCAPGYTMFYVWFMLHLPGNRFGSDSREFVAEHAWAV